MEYDSEKLLTCLEKLPVPFAVFQLNLDEQGKPEKATYLYANPKYGEMVGKDPKEITEAYFFDSIDRTGVDWLDISYKSAYLGQNQCFVWYCIAIDRWLEIHVTQLAEGYCTYTFVDVTNEKEKQFSIEKSWFMDDFVLKCAQILHTGNEEESAMDQVLTEIGQRLQADRVYILETDRIIVNNTYEWCNEGIEPAIDLLQNVPYATMKNWERTLETSALVHYPNVEDLKETSPEEYHLLAIQGIQRLLAVPLYDENKLLGFIGVDNYEENEVYDVKKVLQSVAYFIASDLSRKTLVNQLENMSYHDSLTNALNRVAFMRRLRMNHNRFQKVGIVYVDINGLKSINDVYGHSEGDTLICTMYSFLTDIFSPEDIYRVGGDEFVIVNEQMEEPEFKDRIRKLESKLHQNKILEFAYGYHWVEYTEDIHEIMHIADGKMYENKKKFYEENVIENARYRPFLDDRLGFTDSKVFHDIMTKGQFIFYLQPKTGKDGRTVSSAEALVRYIKDSGDIMAAGEFIPLLESSHHIVTLDYYVFKSVCVQLREWMNKGLRPVRIAVNFSRHTLCQYDFLEEIEKIREAADVPREYLEIEITESTVADNKETLNETIQALSMHGYAVTLDDFGVEEANLVTISEVDFDYVKIDRSITAAVLESPKTYLLVDGLVGICHKLGIQIVAEGIEYKEQMDKLLAVGMDELQGYYFSRPIPCEEFCQKYLME